MFLIRYFLLVSLCCSSSAGKCLASSAPYTPPPPPDQPKADPNTTQKHTRSKYHTQVANIECRRNPRPHSRTKANPEHNPRARAMKNPHEACEDESRRKFSFSHLTCLFHFTSSYDHRHFFTRRTIDIYNIPR